MDGLVDRCPIQAAVAGDLARVFRLELPCGLGQFGQPFFQDQAIRLGEPFDPTKDLAYGLSARCIAKKRQIDLEGSDGFVTSTAAPMATGWSDPVAGGHGYLWKSETFHGARWHRFFPRTGFFQVYPAYVCPKGSVGQIISRDDFSINHPDDDDFRVEMTVVWIQGVLRPPGAKPRYRTLAAKLFMHDILDLFPVMPGCI